MSVNGAAISTLTEKTHNMVFVPPALLETMHIAHLQKHLKPNVFYTTLSFLQKLR